MIIEENELLIHLPFIHDDVGLIRLEAMPLIRICVGEVSHDGCRFQRVLRFRIEEDDGRIRVSRVIECPRWTVDGRDGKAVS